MLKMQNDSLLFIPSSGCVGIGMREERRETQLDGDWNKVKIEQAEYGRRETIRENGEIVVRYEKRIWKEHVTAKVLRLIMDTWRNVGWNKWADAVEAGGEDGDTYDRLGEMASTGEFEEIARAPIARCRFFYVETKIVSPSRKLHVSSAGESDGNFSKV